MIDVSGLSERYSTVKCHSTADLVRREKIDNTSTQYMRDKIFNSDFMQKVGHSKSQDQTAALVELSNVIIDTPTPNAIGQQLVRRIDLGTATKKVRIREPAITAKTGRARAARGRGGRSKFLELKPDDEYESHSSWDLNFLEDADWSVAMEETALISAELQERISQEIIDKIETGTTYNFDIGSNNDALTFADVVEGRSLCRGRNVMPNTLLVSPRHLGDLLTDANFRNGFMYGGMVNQQEGTIGRFLGLDVFESSQCPEQKAFIFDRNNFLLYGVRRDMMLDSYEQVEEGKKEYGICVSSRIDLKTTLTTFSQQLSPDADAP